ncbi:hypothetical protein O3G_MSEX011416 [Manduca sexta]|uniref:BING4 C-terminal domain-containing protein n=2 Tax=Manduca sexta TaxID=7130 RepID=A0A922CV39_MANSE|nr:hypothetical protein O3G_MSEX011416 [Manduca sexta]
MKVKEKQPKRYFVTSDDTSAQKTKHKKKFNKQNVTKNKFTSRKEKNTQKTKNNEDVEVYDVKITPKMYHAQRSQDKKPIRQKPNFKRKKPQNFPGKAPLNPKKLEEYSRGERFQGRGVKNPLHNLKLKKKDRKIHYAEKQAARAEILLTEDQGGIEIEDEDYKTLAITQKVIADNVDIAAAAKIFELNLEFGPYRAKYSRNGRHLLLGSRKGHLAGFDWVTKKLHFEINVMESIHDISWLHVETMVAAAQKEWLYIYDNKGIELHCVKRIDKVLRMEFLPYHFLLACVSEYGFLTWLDISIGEIAGHYNNRLGRTLSMTHNPYNATLCLGDSKGVVSLWAPTVKEPLAKILCHKAPVTAISVNKNGMYMATSGVDRSMKIWDIRKLDGPLQHYMLRSAPVDLEFSQKNMLAVGLGDIVEIYDNCCTRTAEKPYMRHKMAKTVNNFKFCPYEDVLGIGTNRGFTSIIIPGSGEPNFDAYESNPFQTRSQRKEAEVKALLEKIPAELITLNPFEVTEVDVPSMRETLEAKKKLLHVKPKRVDLRPRNKNKGKNRITRQKIIKETARKEQVQQVKEAQGILKGSEQQKKPNQPSFGVLNRFVSNPKSNK